MLRLVSRWFGVLVRGLPWIATSLVVAGACQPAAVCRVSSECSSDSICFDKSCRPRCSATAGCAAGASCVQGACVWLGATCSSSDDCLSFEQCLDGRCRMLCRADDDCQQGMLCSGGSCALPVDAGAGDGARPDGRYDSGADARRSDGARPDASRPDQLRPDTSAGADLFTGRDAVTGTDRASADLGPCPGQEVNACGGCGDLNGQPGTICGACGLVACKNADEVSCVDPGYNLCGSCEQLAAEPEDPCGVCGVYRCDQGALMCDDPGKTTFYYDHDGDNYGGPESDDLCTAAGYYRATETGDCDDHRFDIHPGQPELCDGIDNDCDQLIDPAGSGVCRIWVTDASVQSWRTYTRELDSASHAPPAQATIEAAFAVEGTHQVWALTHSSYHVLHVASMIWVGSGDRAALFAAAAGVTLTQAYGLPTAWVDPDPHADVTLANASTAWIYDYDSEYDTFSLKLTTPYSWSGTYAPDPAAVADVWIDVYNTVGWAPVVHPLCGDELYNPGPYFGCLANGTLHFMDAGLCYEWYYETPAAGWRCFAWPRAPAIPYVEALAWIDDKLVVFAR